MKVVNYDIQLESINHGFVLAPFACVHWDHPGCDIDLFKEFIERAKNTRVYNIGIGDFLDFARSTYRNELRKVLPDNDSPELLDQMVKHRLDTFIDVARPLSNRCIGLVHGNHGWKFITTDRDLDHPFYAGEDSDEYIARELNVPYLEDTSIIQLNVFFRDSDYKDKITIVANHGYGGSAGTAGTDLGAMERKVEPAFDADIYLMAHTHRRFTYMMPELALSSDGKDVIEKSHLLVKAGAFLKAYLPDKETYASRKLLRPLDLGWVEIEFNYQEKKGGLKRRMKSIMEGSYWIN
jgi:hypothetical protein